jgi:hypothetical protein
LATSAPSISTEDKKLIVSRDEGVQLLRKWLNDDNPVSLRILAPGLSASLAGFISKADDVSFTMTHLQDDEVITGEFTLELSGVTNWEYRDLREATDAAKEFLAGRVASAMKLKIGGFECSLYELVEP